MKSALRIVAFSNHTNREGIIALLEVALEALDREQEHLPAIYVAAALQQYVNKLNLPNDPAEAETMQ